MVVLSVLMLVPVSDITAVLDSVTLVVVSVVADFSVEQAVASKVIASRKNADLAICVMRDTG